LRRRTIRPPWNTSRVCRSCHRKRDSIAVLAFFPSNLAAHTAFTNGCPAPRALALEIGGARTPSGNRARLRAKERVDGLRRSARHGLERGGARVDICACHRRALREVLHLAHFHGSVGLRSFRWNHIGRPGLSLSRAFGSSFCSHSREGCLIGTTKSESALGRREVCTGHRIGGVRLRRILLLTAAARHDRSDEEESMGRAKHFWIIPHLARHARRAKMQRSGPGWEYCLVTG